MYKIMKHNDQQLELYVKIDDRFKPISKEVINSVVKQYKKRTRTKGILEKIERR